MISLFLSIAVVGAEEFGKSKKQNPIVTDAHILKSDGNLMDLMRNTKKSIGRWYKSIETVDDQTKYCKTSGKSLADKISPQRFVKKHLFKWDQGRVRCFMKSLGNGYCYWGPSAFKNECLPTECTKLKKDDCMSEEWKFKDCKWHNGEFKKVDGEKKFQEALMENGEWIVGGCRSPLWFDEGSVLANAGIASNNIKKVMGQAKKNLKGFWKEKVKGC